MIITVCVSISHYKPDFKLDLNQTHMMNGYRLGLMYIVVDHSSEWVCCGSLVST